MQKRDEQNYENFRASKIQKQQFEVSHSLKIEQCLKSASELEAQISLKQARVQYLEAMCSFLNNNTFKSGRGASFKTLQQKSALKTLSTPSIKIVQLEKDAISWERKNYSKLKQSKFIENSELSQCNSRNLPGKPRCDISSHLKELLNSEQEDNEANKQIQELQILKNTLYGKINQKLQEDEPYIHQKIMAKIQRDAQKYIKSQLVRDLEGVTKQKKNWIEENKRKVDKETLMRSVEQSISSNLSKMKELLSKKLQVDSYIQSIAENERIMNKNIQKLRNLGSFFQQHTSENLRKMKETEVESKITGLRDTQKRQQSVMSQRQVQQLNDLMVVAMEQLKNNLGSKTSEGILGQIDEVSQQMVLKKQNR